MIVDSKFCTSSLEYPRAFNAVVQILHILVHCKAAPHSNLHSAPEMARTKCSLYGKEWDTMEEKSALAALLSSPSHGEMNKCIQSAALYGKRQPIGKNDHTPYISPEAKFTLPVKIQMNSNLQVHFCSPSFFRSSARSISIRVNLNIASALIREQLR